MRSQHDNLVFVWAGARNFAHYIKAIRVAVKKLVLHIEFQLHRDLMPKQARDAVILLRHEHDRRHGRRVFGS